MRGSKVLSWVVLGALTLGVVTMLSLILYQQGVSADESRDQQAEIAALQSGLDEANSRLAEQGEPPVDVPEVDTGADPPAPPVVIPERGPGPTSLQVSAAVQEYCAGGRCDGEGPTKAQVASAVTAFCANDACRGEAAPPAVDGKVGATGAQGPGPTADQIKAAVEAYCADGVCRGANGTNGKDSTVPGPRGVGIAKIECPASGDWIITYTDDTAGTVTGPCRVATSTPTPTSTPLKGK